MDDPHHPAGLPKPAPWFPWLAGRAGRREYWVFVGVLFGVGLAAEYFPGGPQLSSGLSAVLMLEQIRRMHDCGRSGWWAVAALFAPLIVTIPMVAFGLPAAGLIAAVVLGVVQIIWIGLIRGDADENRFGPPPSFTLKRLATGR